MSRASDRLRELLAAPSATSVAPIFDPLSARIANMLGWEVCKVSGSVGKYANLAVPDGLPMTNNSDLVDVIRRITRVADISLVVDADDGGSALALYRYIPELEAAGVAGLELEDNLVPAHFTTERHGAMIPKEEHVAKLKAAVAARKDASTVIIGRTAALFTCPLEESLDRISAYAKAGVDAIMLPGLGKNGISPNPRSDIEAVHAVAGLPLCVSGLSADLVEDKDWMRANRVQLRYNPQAPFRTAVKAIYDSLIALSTGNEQYHRDKWAPQEIVDQLTRSPELREWDDRFSAG
jgi:oxaloacetate decarboxylase